jgi:SOS response regulatory protein OraA/RecX
MRFLAARGFGGDTIRRVVRGAADDDTPAPGDAVDA